jgi:hypothetical protein
MVDKGCLRIQFLELYDLPFNNGRPAWVQEVIRLRETLWRPTDLRKTCLAGIGYRLEPVKAIIQDLELSWRYPCAIYFTSLIGPVSLIEERGVAIHNTRFESLKSGYPKGGSTKQYYCHKASQ